MTDDYDHDFQSELNRSLLTEGDFTEEPIDLTNCEKEPIHIPGMIQPHGALLAAANDEARTVVQCSRNTDLLLGATAESLLGQPLSAVIGERALAFIEESLARPAAGDMQHFLEMKIDLPGGPAEFFAIFHVSDDLLIVELERPADGDAPAVDDFEWVQAFFTRIKRTHSRAGASQVAAELVKDILGYDRVMVYEFDADWNGKVIAEAKNSAMEPFLGHHYPASDIPKQARALYLRNWVRTIVDMDYEPVPVVPAFQPSGKPLNLSLSVLRSVSPMHIEYMRNMGVGATMTISLIHGGELWGMIACHHDTPKYVPHRQRNLCNFLGSFFSSELHQRQRLDDYQGELRLKSLAQRLARVFGAPGTPEQLKEKLRADEDALLSVMNASGAAVQFKGRLLLFGSTPGAAEIVKLAVWLSQQAEDYAYHTNRLASVYPQAAAYPDKAAGVVFLSLSSDYRDHILWFRPEVVQTVTWAGDPAKAVVRSGEGYRISPRKSFAAWQEVVTNTSLPWEPKELHTLSDLKSIALKQTEEDLRLAEEKSILYARMLKENESRYLQLMEYSAVAFVTLTEGRIVFANLEAARLLRVSQAADLIGRELADWIDPSSETELADMLSRIVAAATQLRSCRLRMMSDSDAKDAPVELEMTLAHVVYGGKPSIMAIAREAVADAGEENLFTEVTRELSRYIHTDSLTELPNRRCFDENLTKDWLQCADNDKAMAIVMLDLDNFRSYNAMFGYQGADNCLRWVAESLSAVGNLRQAVISRYGGASFVLTMAEEPTSEGLARVDRLADQLRQTVISLQIPHPQPGVGEYLTASVGVAVETDVREGNPSDLVARAEKALAIAKAEGKNRVFAL
ncbi:PAS domain S-box-containing protein/diguanylate cyclase (GGDEF) domain-containing protein [Cohnella sp. OV330]|uniref:diguanylate cyclase domain-containing protein n=1 Tax=Cohnella sp. OV330 TaxID=1855288 RepID=UPI0008ECC5E6|nr:diguanylate cyclase [Cohnella sp. OV330]SFB28954.1 PAS domain S-box-containing protein/diguanylate cyclase (GGDEF) domain-containing protein [Cohnella sp. OV330]